MNTIVTGPPRPRGTVCPARPLCLEYPGSRPDGTTALDRRGHPHTGLHYPCVLGGGLFVEGGGKERHGWGGGWSKTEALRANTPPPSREMGPEWPTFRTAHGAPPYSGGDRGRSGGHTVTDGGWAVDCGAPEGRFHAPALRVRGGGGAESRGVVLRFAGLGVRNARSGAHHLAGHARPFGPSPARRTYAGGRRTSCQGPDRTKRRRPRGGRPRKRADGRAGRVCGAAAEQGWGGGGAVTVSVGGRGSGHGK